jgi:hypothetical protein
MLVRRSFVLSFCTLWCACALAQDPNETIRRIVDAEYSAYQNDHSDLVYLQETRQSGHHVVQWVVHTDQGEVRRPLELDDRPVSDSKDRELIQHFLRNPDGRKKQLPRPVTISSSSSNSLGCFLPHLCGNKRVQAQQRFAFISNPHRNFTRQPAKRESSVV